MNSSCPQCGTSLPISARFCNNCGHSISLGTIRTPVNPYSSLYPVERFDLLYGRQKLMGSFSGMLSELRKYRQPCISLVGLTRSGKTSVLNAVASADRQYLDVIGSQPVKDVLFVRVDCSGLPEETPASFWRFTTFQLIKTSKERLPSFAFQPYQFSDATAFEICYWHLQQLAQQELIVAFLFDEFDRVAAGLSREVADNLRFLLDDLPGRIWHVTATRRPLKSYNSWAQSKNTSGPLTYFTGTEYLGLLEVTQPNGTYDFIRLPALANGVSFTDDDVNFALATGARHPDLTRQTCMRLFDARLKQPQGKLDYDLFKRAAYADFESFYGHFWPALPVEQQDALIYFATGDQSRNRISEEAVNELHDLGLLEYFSGGDRLFSSYMVDVIRSHHQPKFTYYKPILQSNRQVTQAPFDNQPPYVVAPPLFIPQSRRNKKFLVALYFVVVLVFALCTLGIIDWASSGVVFNEISSLFTAHAFMQSALVALVILLELAIIVGIMWRSLSIWEKRWKSKMEKTPASSSEGAMIAKKSSKDAALEFGIGVAASALAGIISTVVATVLLHLLHQ